MDARSAAAAAATLCALRGALGPARGLVAAGSSSACCRRVRWRLSSPSTLGPARERPRVCFGVLGGSQLWAVVKADAYGHGAADVGRIALERRAQALCVSTPGEGLALRSALPEARILVIGPHAGRDVRAIREHVSSSPSRSLRFPRDTAPREARHRHGPLRLPELPEPPDGVVGFMSHLATADEDPTFAQRAGRALSRAGGRPPGSRGARREQRCGHPPAGIALRPPAAASRSTASRHSAGIRPTTGSSRSCPGAASSRR